MSHNTLTKSQYMKGVQCPKALWLHFHRKDLRPQEGDNSQIEAGIEVGELARELYPDGVVVNEEPTFLTDMVRKTQAAIDNGATILYEASAISPDGVRRRVSCSMCNSCTPTAPIHGRNFARS